MLKMLADPALLAAAGNAAQEFARSLSLKGDLAQLRSFLVDRGAC